MTLNSRELAVRFWCVVAGTLLIHFTVLVAVFFYAMSWVFYGPELVPIRTRMAAAESALAVISFPLSAIIAAFPDFHIEGYLGWIPYVMVSSLWAYVIARLLVSRWLAGTVQ